MDSRAFLHILTVISVVVLIANGKPSSIKESKESRTRAVRDVDVEVSYEPVGCYRDDASRRGKNRALETLVKSFRGNAWIWSRWPDMTTVIQSCAEEAFAAGYKMVGIQHYAECWSSKQAEQKYDMHKKSKNCINGVGKGLANYVYRVYAKPIPPKAADSVCTVGDYTFKNGDSMEVYKGDLVNGTCQQCSCQSGLLVDCHHLFHCVLNDTSCKRYVKKPNQCCPTCEKDIPQDAPVCRVDGDVINQGQSIEMLKDGRGNLSECHQCTCMGGKLVDCHRIYYCHPNKISCTLVRSPGQCCPKCARVIPKSPPPACSVGGRKYRHGQSMEVLQMTEDQKEAVCDQCICDKGKLDNCHHLFNCSLNNPNCSSYVKRPGQCCPECVPAQPNQNAPGCMILGEQYKSGESAEVLVESVNKSIIYCQQCRCKAGQHKCHKIYDCDIQSGACEKSLKISGQCCPVCACYHNGKQMGANYKWQKSSGSDCIQCTCQENGSANCERVAKDACP